MKATNLRSLARLLVIAFAAFGIELTADQALAIMGAIETAFIIGRQINERTKSGTKGAEDLEASQEAGGIPSNTV